MGRLRWVLLGVLGSLWFPGSGLSQTTGKWEFTPNVAYYLTLTDIGPVAPVSAARYLAVQDLEPTGSVGLLATRTLPLDGMALSFRGLLTLPADAPGTFDCLPGLACPAILLKSGAEVWMWSGVAGLLYSPSSAISSVTPFLTLGVGLKQNRFSWPENDEWVDGDGRAETVGTVQFGIGIDLELGPVPLRLEVMDYWTAEGDPFDVDHPGAGLSSLQPLRRTSQHDLIISLGWVLSLG